MKQGRLVDTTKEHVEIRTRRLPHWTVESGIYFVTFRLADSLPAQLVRANLLRLEAALQQNDPTELKRTRRDIARQSEAALDRGFGSCVLKNHECANIVANALNHFDGVRCDIYGWCVMPNHVHVVVSPYAGWELGSLTKSWKGYSSRHINVMLGRSGRLFQPESFDHLIRSNKSLIGTLDYVWKNPARAGLSDWPWVKIVDFAGYTG